MMKTSLKSGKVGLAIGLTVAAASAQGAAQVTQHQHSAPTAQKPAANGMKGMHGMKDMHAMMADPAMRQKMMTNMAHCRDMMSMMIEHMKHEGKPGEAAPAPHKH